MGELGDLSLSRFCSLMWWMMSRNLETEAEIAALEARIWRPPAKAPAPATGPWSAEAEMSAFANLKVALGQ